MYCGSSTAHCPQAVRQCIAGVPLPTAPREWGSVLRELHCPLPPGSEAVHCRSSTAHCTKAGRQRMAGVPLPTALRQCGSAKHDFHCPQPPGCLAVRYTAHCPLPTTTVQQGTHSAVWCRAPSSAAPHKRHWWCSAARRVQWANETLCDCAQASARQCRPIARVHWSGYATTHLHTARTQHTQPSPFTCTRG